MGRSVNVWVQRFLVPCFAIAAMALAHFGFGARKMVTIIVPIYVVLMLLLIVVDPGPRARGFVEGLRERLR
jgi:hypothetical protein